MTLTLQQRADNYNTAFSHLGPPNTQLKIESKNGKQFVHGFWFIGGGTGNISDFYGSYQSEYLDRITSLFPDRRGRKEVVHLFSGSLPPSDSYTRVGQDPTGQYKSDVECDIHNLSSYLAFNPGLIYVDPPYSREDSEHYQNSMVNRPRIVEECALVLKPGGFLVWMDQAMVVFSNNTFRFIGAIGYIRSTGNRFRMISIFQKHCNIK